MGEPLWGGPDGKGKNAGVTQSLIQKWLVDREATRILLVEGLRPRREFDPALEYGSMLHIMAQAASSEVNHFGWVVGTTLGEDNLREYVSSLIKRYPFQRQQIEHWAKVCLVQFPIYLDYWSKRERVIQREILLTEKVFWVPYTLPSGRVINLRGKWDLVYAGDEGLDLGQGVWLCDHKTKSVIDEGSIDRKLVRDWQMLFYTIALNEGRYLSPVVEVFPKGKCLHGFVYNVIRRPLGGGRGSIRKHKATKSKPEETDQAFYNRLREVIWGDQDSYFARYIMPVSQEDIASFKRQTFDPILEQFCDWWDWIVYTKGDPYRPNPHPEEDEDLRLNLPYGLHWRMPSGIWGINQEVSDDMEACMDTGSTVGMERVTTVFPELEEAE